MKLIRIFAIGIAILLICFIGFYFWISNEMARPFDHPSANKMIVIKNGTAPRHVVSKLASERIIESPLIVQVYLRLFLSTPAFSAGEYRFSTPISPQDIFALLERGSEESIRLTIPEGWTRFEIAKRIAAKFKVPSESSEAEILELMNNVSLISDLDPKAKNLEGYLYPTTYEFRLDATPKKVVARLVEQFRETWKSEWTAKALEQGKSIREIVTIASLIENESKYANERNLVSSVIHNRLERKMALGIDATNVYIAKLRGKWDGVINKSDIEIDHPYNTRRIRGLPPGPISSASESAFEAALNPAQTNYIYYVLNVEKNDGSHRFYTSAAEFERGKTAYQKWLAEQRRLQKR